jgi:hypothetical protein
MALHIFLFLALILTCPKKPSGPIFILQMGTPMKRNGIGDKALAKLELVEGLSAGQDSHRAMLMVHAILFILNLMGIG